MTELDTVCRIDDLTIDFARRKVYDEKHQEIALPALSFDTLRALVEEWLPHSGFRRRSGPVLERYLNDPREATEEELRTEVCLPVSPDPVE